VVLSGGGQTIAGTVAAPQRIWFNSGYGILDAANQDFFHVNSIARNGAGGISVGLGTPSGSVSLSADRRTVALTFSVATPGQTVIGEVFENPGVPSCPGQGETFAGTASQVVGASGAGTLTITLSQPLAAGDGLTATLTDTQRGTSAFICFVAPSPTPVLTPTLAAISRLRANPTVFPAASSGGSIAARRRRKTGTTISYTDNQGATTTFTVRNPQPGVKNKRRGCIKPRKGQRVRRSQRCTRYVAVGTSSTATGQVPTKFPFTGARDTSKNGRTPSLKFRIIR